LNAARVNGERGIFTGSVTVGADLRPANNTEPGTLRWNSGALQSSDGNEWGDVSKQPLGSELNPAPSAQAIINAGDSIGDGVYWLTVNGVDGEYYCDMTTNGGGWVLLMNIHTADNYMTHYSNNEFWESSTVCGMNATSGGGCHTGIVTTADGSDIAGKTWKSLHGGNGWKNLEGTKMMIKIHSGTFGGTIGWKSWNLLAGKRKLGDMWTGTRGYSNWQTAGRITDGSIASDTGNIHTNEPIVKPTYGDLWANFVNPSVDANRITQSYSGSNYPMGDNSGGGIGTYYDTSSGGRPESDAQMINTATWNVGRIGTDTLDDGNFSSWNGKAAGGYSSTYNWNGLSNETFHYAFFIKD